MQMVKKKGRRIGVALLISDKMDIKEKTIKRNIKGHYIMIKGPIHQEGIIRKD